MSQVSLQAKAGRAPGSRESRRIRRTGNVPAVVYGRNLDPIPVSVDAHDLHVALHTDAGANALINLEIDGADTLLTLARVIERHPYRSEYRHVDFVTVALDETITIEVVIDFQGTPFGVKEGGVFSPQRTHVMIETLATAIPSSIPLDISDVDVGGSLRISDLPVMEGVIYTEDLEAVVMSVTTPAAEIIEEPTEAELEAAEGDESIQGEGDEASGTEEGAEGNQAE